MVNVYDVYPSLKGYSGTGGLEVGGYTPILEAFGEILLRVDSEGFSGDSWVWYKKEGKYGFLQFGWGSCTVCDALEACETVQEVQELINKLESSIRWFDSVQEALNFMGTHDWEGEYSASDEAQKRFIKAAKFWLKREAQQ